MPVLNNPRHEKFANLVASGLTLTKAYVKAGYSARGARQSAHTLLTNPDVSMRVSELTLQNTNRVQNATVRRRITERNARINELQDRWDELREAIDAILVERGEEMAQPIPRTEGEANDANGEPMPFYYIAGVSTGFIVRDYKGKDANVPVYLIDTGLLSMIRDLFSIQKMMAQELGQWNPKRPIAAEDLVASKYDLKRLTPEELDTFLKISAKAKKPTIQ